jgi:uncharacterized protein
MIETKEVTMHRELLEVIKQHYILDWEGIHGIPHWERVCRNGEHLAEKTGANIHLVRLFAYLHDACRQNDDTDPEHGLRAALFIESINAKLLHLSPGDLEILTCACIDHSRGKLFHTNITVMTCWDADRLDLGRVGTRPNPHKLCTAPAKDRKLILWAYENSRKG